MFNIICPTSLGTIVSVQCGTIFILQQRKQTEGRGKKEGEKGKQKREEQKEKWIISYYFVRIL